MRKYIMNEEATYIKMILLHMGKFWSGEFVLHQYFTR